MKNKKAERPCSVIQLLSQGRFSEIEKLCINNPSLRNVLLQWRGVRHTAFFKKRLKFYKKFAQKSGLRKFTPDVKNQMRDEFAREHCLKKVLKRTLVDVKPQSCDGLKQSSLIDFLKRRRKGRLGLF